MAMSDSLLFSERPCDLTGYPVTCSGCQEALQLYNKGLKSVVSGVDNCGYFFFEALQLDGSFTLANCVLVGVCVFVLL